MKFNLNASSCCSPSLKGESLKEDVGAVLYAEVSAKTKAGLNELFDKVLSSRKKKKKQHNFLKKIIVIMID